MYGGLAEVVGDGGGCWILRSARRAQLLAELLLQGLEVVRSVDLLLSCLIGGMNHGGITDSPHSPDWSE